MEQIKKEIIRIAKINNACREGINDALNSNNELELFLTIKKHLRWLIQSKTIDSNWLESKFKRELMIENGVLTSGEHFFENPKTLIITLGSSSATIETRDSSSATYSVNSTFGATVKDLNKRKIFIKKSEWEIEVLD